MNLKILFMFMIIFFLNLGCDNFLSPGNEKISAITINEPVINPGRTYELSANFTNISNGEIEWNCDYGYFITATNLESVIWTAPKKKIVCKIECKKFDPQKEEKLDLLVKVENDKPVLKNIVTELDNRYIFVNTDVWDDDNTPFEISYNYDADTSLIVGGYGNEIRGDHNFVFLGFSIPWDENYHLIPGDYWVKLRIFDFVDTVEIEHHFTYPPQ